MLIEQLQKDSLTARKNRETDKAAVLTTLLSTVKTAAIDSGNRDVIQDADVIKVVRQFLKSVNENLELAAQGKLSGDMAEKYKQEKDILEAYLPSQLSEDKIKSIITESGATNLGEAMKFLKEKYDGQYDGKMASNVARSIFQ
ncbi:MAG: GatB/YqeY domain-containing protein [Leptospiraceae bacterium]|nr:GatB/YqeY domain-containing protein [Leptospiraceae bacterium]